jgi:uncharacterized damage-inducible protein DinB
MSTSMAQAVLPEFDHEMETTRNVIARVPEAEAAWKPHPKSFSLGDLTAHVINLTTWTGFTLKETELDLNPVGGEQWKAPSFTTTAEALALFDKNVKAAREAIETTSDEDFLVTWTLKSAGETVLALPRVVVLRSFVMNHLIHHRGQLTVYLRLKNVPLPSVYGPTADETSM